jgi:hypothetical protein
MKQKTNKKVIGIIGEHPNNDSQALIALLDKFVCDDWELKVCDLKGLRGARLDNFRDFQALLQIEKLEESYERFIIIRDLDGLEKDKTKIKQKESWFKKVKQIINDESYFFLVIYELETLMLCDLDTINRFFGTNITLDKGPMKILSPKEAILMRGTEKSVKGKYDPSFSEAIFQKISFEKIYQNHTGERSFQSFADQLKAQEIIDF